MLKPWVYVLLIFLSWLLTAILRAYAVKRNVLDVPNQRSSHKIPTPRGGGLAVVICYLAFTSVIAGLNFMSWPMALGLVLSGILVAFIGFLDDHGHVKASLRLMVHFTAASIVVFVAGPLPELVMFGYQIDFGQLAYILAVLGVVWVLNLYNFMDGIDGIAAIEAVSVCIVMVLLVYFGNRHDYLLLLHLGLASCVTGFLIWNHPPAKIFMGDAGSGFVGLSIAALVLLSANVSADLLWAWLIMLGVFIVDATYTLVARSMRGMKFYQAHRSHAYQHAALRFGKHWPVSYGVCLINLCWLAPWSWLVVFYDLDGAIALILAYSPLLYLAHHYRAGKDSC
ncbi:glycosyl transferase [Rheinheimera sp. SA_1]|uniref:MraY family glycosyltransferase n=1 Tax=Rheinheimera sp. SA_1 TaxID=1827365 RepID=UPI00080247EE|nr:glycosyltransferase family 4 protein [Rheinheimera sp. SA_1]OBP15332.1 glycosyl transferase [Rheinheimera sp. SA_1]